MIFVTPLLASMKAVGWTDAFDTLALGSALAALGLLRLLCLNRRAATSLPLVAAHAQEQDGSVFFEPNAAAQRARGTTLHCASPVAARSTDTIVAAAAA